LRGSATPGAAEDADCCLPFIFLGEDFNPAVVK
jgi:hypothetical protein